MANPIVQILDSEGAVQGKDELPGLNSQRLIKLYCLMLLNRRVDERMITLHRQGRIGFYVGSIGEEASIIGSAAALQPTDWVFPCYRELGAALLRGFSLESFCNQLFGTSKDATKGRQMPNHYAIPELFYSSISSCVGTQIPHATGVAIAAKITKSSDVALAYFGDGATSTGDFHASCNLAGSMKAPVVFLCRNNQWAISVPVQKQTAVKSLSEKAAGYGFDGVCVDGNDLLAVYRETLSAVEKARKGEGPTLIEALTYRLEGHSTSDDPRVYRSEEETQLWRTRDPLKRLRTYLIHKGLWSEKQDDKLEADTKKRILEAIQKVEGKGQPHLKSVFSDVYDEIPWNLEEQWEELRNSKNQIPLKSKT